MLVGLALFAALATSCAENYPHCVPDSSQACVKYLSVRMASSFKLVYKSLRLNSDTLILACLIGPATSLITVFFLGVVSIVLLRDFIHLQPVFYLTKMSLVVVTAFFWVKLGKASQPMLVGSPSRKDALTSSTGSK